MVLAIIFLAAGPADAQVLAGLRAGLSVDPDQFYFGGHIEAGPSGSDLIFRPNLETGFGDRRTLIALNGEFAYRFRLDQGYAAYLGAGPAVNVITRDRPVRDTRVEPGLNFLIGLMLPQNFFGELKVGAFDSPRVKLGFGYTFR